MGWQVAVSGELRRPRRRALSSQLMIRWWWLGLFCDWDWNCLGIGIVLGLALGLIGELQRPRRRVSSSQVMWWSCKDDWDCLGLGLFGDWDWFGNSIRLFQKLLRPRRRVSSSHWWSCDDWDCLGIGIVLGLVLGLFGELRRPRRRVLNSQLMMIFTPKMMYHDDYYHFSDVLIKQVLSWRWWFLLFLQVCAGPCVDKEGEMVCPFVKWQLDEVASIYW